jgi:hypothetical protein
MWIKSSLIALGFAGAMVASTNALAGQQADAPALFRVPAFGSGLPLGVKTKR